MSKHSLISPSSFERRLLCHGSLNAEKDLPNVTSKYADEGTMLHERVAMMSKDTDSPWRDGLTKEQCGVVRIAVDYYTGLISGPNIGGFNIEFESEYDLSFIYPGMKGTVDTAIILRDFANDNVEIHVIDYKFGKGVAVDAKYNYQLLLYAIGLLNGWKIGKHKYSLHLHIVQPYIKNSRWDLTEEERVKWCDIEFYKNVAKECYKPDAKRTPHVKACKFCKAKPTCKALAGLVPNLKRKVSDMTDDEITKIYDNKALIITYVKSVEKYLENKVDTGDIEGYEFRDKLSNRKWVDGAELLLLDLLDESVVYDNNRTLISVTKAEKLLDKETVNSLTRKDVTGKKIVKVVK